MQILNSTVSKSNNPNYDVEINIVESIFKNLVDVMEKKTSVSDYLASDYKVIHAKNYFLSTQPKEIFYRDSDRSIGADLGVFYKRNGEIEHLSINSNSVLSHFCFNRNISGICFMFDLNQINITTKNNYGLRIDYSISGNTIKLTNYSMNRNFLNDYSDYH